MDDSVLHNAISIEEAFVVLRLVSKDGDIVIEEVLYITTA